MTLNINSKLNKLLYEGKVSKIYGIWIINLLLTIVTLGTYRFWGKTRMRRYLVHSFSLQGDKFEYTGKGIELFKGFLKAMLVVLILYAILVGLPLYLVCLDQEINILNLTFDREFTIMRELSNSKFSFFLWIGFILCIYILPPFLALMGFYYSMKYRYSRLMLRGIRGKLKGFAFTYASLKVGTYIKDSWTLKLCTPYWDLKVSKYIIDNTYFGNFKAEYKESLNGIYLIHWVTLLLAIPTLLISRVWYYAAFKRKVLSSIKLGTLSFVGTYTGFNLLRLYIGNLLIFIFTMGLGTPLIIQRNMKYFADNFFIVGDIDSIEIRQSDEKLSKSGEGINALFGDNDIGF